MRSEVVELQQQSKLLDGRPIAAAMRSELTQEAHAFERQAGRRAGLAIVLATDDPACRLYSNRLSKTAHSTGLDCRVVAVEDRTPLAIQRTLSMLNDDDLVDGVLVQMPLPPPMTVSDISTVIDPRKDVDGISIVNVGRIAMGLPGFAPTTPLGGLELLRRYEIPIAGRRAVVVGRSNVVGRPFAALLLAADATVTLCHRRTPDLHHLTRDADLVAVAVGIPGLLGADAIRPGAVVVDFGTTPTEAGLKGDVDFDAVAPKAGWITPVPGGTGPMTNVMVLRQTLDAARARVAD